MDDSETTGQILRRLMDKAGLSVRAFAEAAGYSHGSGIQRYIDPDFDGPLQMRVAIKLAQALVGRPGMSDEQDILAEILGLGAPMLATVKYEGASEERMRYDVPVLGTALGADRIQDSLAIEQTCLYENEVIHYASRPVVLNGRADAYGLYVQGSSMDPAFPDGSLIFVESRRQPSVGEYAVVYLRMNGDCDESDHNGAARMVMVKRVVRKSGSHIELEQFQPKLTFHVSMIDVLKIHRVIPWGELLA